MNDFYILNNAHTITAKQDFSGNIIFYKKSKQQNVAETQHNLLDKLIQNALKLSLDNFIFIDLNEQQIKLHELRKIAKVENCFLFGVNESEIGTNIVIPNYQLVNVADIQFLKIDAPETIDANKNLKSKLWEQLQIAFKLVS